MGRYVLNLKKKKKKLPSFYVDTKYPDAEFIYFVSHELKVIGFEHLAHTEDIIKNIYILKKRSNESLFLTS